MKRPWVSGEPSPARGRPKSGRILRLTRGQGNGYIGLKGSADVFFDRRDVVDSGFNDLSVGDAVTFELIEDRLSGPRGILIRKRAKKKPEAE